MFLQLFFSKVYPACHNTLSNQKVTKKADKHAAVCSKAVCCMLGRKVIYVRCINCSYNKVAKGIHLLDKKAFFFVYTGKISCK